MRKPFEDGYRVTADFVAHLQRTPPSKAPGIDFALPLGTEVLAAGDGRVIRSEWSQAGGRYVLVEHEDGVRTLYSHLRAVWRVKGERVQAGDVIGLSGQTGRATGPHLHFGVWVPGSGWVNPAVEIASLTG